MSAKVVGFGISLIVVRLFKIVDIHYLITAYN